jgi:hypothetical protein
MSSLHQIIQHSKHCRLWRFKQLSKKLPKKIQNLTNEAFAKLIENPQLASLDVHFVKVNSGNDKNVYYYSFSVAIAGCQYKALAYINETFNGEKNVYKIIWYFIGTHDEYSRLLSGK